MSYNPLVDYSSQSSKTIGLKPVLASALASLEVQLDQELVRYRRNRGTYKKSSQAPNQTVVGNFEPQSLVQNASTVTQSNFAASSQAATPTIKITPPPPPPIPETLEVPLGAATQAAQIQEQINFNEELNDKTVSEFNPELFSQEETTKTVNAPLSASIVKASTRTSGSQGTSVTETDNTQKQPDDYLESSEALLRSLAEEQPKAQKRNEINSSSLLSPLGIGSMLLLLLASLTLGYVVFNPKSLPQFGFGGNNAKEKADATSKPKIQPTPIAKHPNLATDQFAEVNTANDVVGLQPKAKPTSAVQNPPTTSTIPVQQVQTGTPTTNPQTTPTPTPKTTSLREAEIQQSAGGLYQVFIPNDGAEAFTKARKSVPDAYVSDDGKLIYLGAFRTKAEAEKHLKELEASGIKAKTN